MVERGGAVMALGVRAGSLRMVFTSRIDWFPILLLQTPRCEWVVSSRPGCYGWSDKFFHDDSAVSIIFDRHAAGESGMTCVLVAFRRRAYSGPPEASRAASPALGPRAVVISVDAGPIAPP